MLYLTDLSISAFRGVPGTIALRLDAPLTVICAPNGTGKTTICDAAEWLVTNAAERLEGVPDEDWRCHYALSSLPTHVQGKVSSGGHESTIDRRIEAPRLALRTEGTNRSIRDGQLLDWLLPGIATSFSPGLARMTRQREWVRATHFLSSERLSRLLDSDDSLRQDRQQIFADLLGVGLLQRMASRMATIATAVEKEYGDRVAALALIGSASTRLQNQLKQSGAGADSETLLASAESAAAALDIPWDSAAVKGTGLGAVVERLTAQAAKRNLALAQQEPAWTTLRASVAFDTSTRTNLASRAGGVASLVAQLETLRRGLKDKRERMARLEAELHTARTRDAQLGRALALLAESSAALRRASERWSLSDAEVNELLASALRESPANIERSLQTASWARKQLAAALPGHRELQKTAADLTVLASEAALLQHEEDARRSHEAAAREVADCESQWRSLASTTERLTQLAREFAERHEREGKCPVCAHDWKSPGGLHAAMSRAASSLEGEVAVAGKRLEALRAAARTAEHTLAGASKARANRQSLDRRAAQLGETLRPFLAACASLGVAEDRAFDAAAIERAASRLQAQQELTKLAQAAQPLLPEEGARPSGLELGRMLTLATSEHSTSRETLGGTIRTLELETQTLAKAIAEHTSAEAVLKTNVDEAERAAAEIGAMDGKRDAAAAMLGFTATPDAAEITRTWTAWTSSCETIKGIEATLRSVSASLLASSWRGQIQELHQQHAAAETAVTSIRRRRDDVSELRAFISNELTATQKRRIDSLSDTVEALFLKMHAARIAEGVKVGEDSTSFSVCIGDWISNPRDLSQGQRQDLALSIFFARARAYGGTFFLDEPLLHLDDLNRVALLDVLRTIAIQDGSRVRLVVTTASSSVLAHLRQKCVGLRTSDDLPLLRTYELTGTVRDTVVAQEQTS